MLLVAPSRRHEDQLGKLRVQLIEEGGGIAGIAAQRAEIGNQDAATAADQQVDGGISRGSVPDRVLGTGRLAQSREHARVRREHYDIENVPRKPGASVQRSEAGILPRAVHDIPGCLTRGRRPAAPSGCAS
jgi:hypothetical protein